MGKKMENNIRFRNHISIVAERLGRVLLLVIVAAISGLAQNVKALANSSGMDAKDAKVILLACGAILLLLAIGRPGSSSSGRRLIFPSMTIPS